MQVFGDIPINQKDLKNICYLKRYTSMEIFFKQGLMKSRLAKANLKLTLLAGAGVVTYLVICFAIIALKWLQSSCLGS